MPLTNSTDFMDARSHVYGLAHNVCRNAEEQAVLIAALHGIERELRGEPGKTIILQMLGVIMDGLNYGNWPWIKNGVNTLG